MSLIDHTVSFYAVMLRLATADNNGIVQVVSVRSRIKHTGIKEDK